MEELRALEPVELFYINTVSAFGKPVASGLGAEQSDSKNLIYKFSFTKWTEFKGKTEKKCSQT